VRRLFWIALGATAGVLVARQLAKTARNLTPDGAADRIVHALGGVGHSIREFADDVRTGMDERDTELRQALGIADNGGGADPDPGRLQDMFEHNYPRGT
jgi:hypothetical protein